MNPTKSHWTTRIYPLVMVGCAQFILLTIIAMLTYAGGTKFEPTRGEYCLFHNFFSDLGRTVAHSGDTNTISFWLFTIALSVAGLALILYFMVAPTLYTGNRTALILSILGGLVGVFSGASFIGIALTPGDVHGELHSTFVDYAFQSYFVAVLISLIAMLVDRRLPRVNLWVFVGFAILLAVYIWLLFYGPSSDTETGLVIQVTGQKIIAYAAVVTMFLEANGAWRYRRAFSKTQSQT